MNTSHKSESRRRVALYARYCSDQQRAASIEDQFRNCRRRAGSEGWSIAETFADEAMSGADSNRPRISGDARCRVTSRYRRSSLLTCVIRTSGKHKRRRRSQAVPDAIGDLRFTAIEGIPSLPSANASIAPISARSTESSAPYDVSRNRARPLQCCKLFVCTGQRSVDRTRCQPPLASVASTGWMKIYCELQSYLPMWRAIRCA